MRNFAVEFAEYTVPKLVQYVSDYHKDTFGYRCAPDSHMRDPEDVRGDCFIMIENLDKFLDRMAESDDGRNTLQQNNWII